jgi:hypothetical protein
MIPIKVNVPISQEQAFALSGQAHNRLLKFSSTRSITNWQPLGLNATLFHYTTAIGLKGIIEENYLRASSAYFLNDSSEIDYGCGVVDAVLGKWRPTNAVSQRAVHELRDLFTNENSRTQRIKSIYVACFCDDGNLLSQWRTYGQVGGYSIGFPFSGPGLTSGITPEPNTYTAQLINVEYDKDAQAARCKNVLDEVLSILEDNTVAQSLLALEWHAQAGYSLFVRCLEELLLDEVMGLKHEAFKAEREWRLTVRPRSLVKQGTDDGGLTSPPIYFDVSKGIFVPYVKLVPAGQNKLPIRCIRFGPSLDKAKSEVSIGMFLEANGFQGVTLAGAEIPVLLNK